MNEYNITVGYDVETDCLAEITMNLQTHLHGAIVGSSGSGKSFALAWLIYQILSLDVPIELFLADPKCSDDLTGIVPPDHYADGIIDSAQLIHKYFEIFQNTPENNNTYRLLLIEEYAGLISSIGSIGKEGKHEVEKIKSEMASLMMLSRSKKLGIWTVYQRPSAQYYASASGSLDNHMFALNMGKMHTQTHISLFSNECLENKEFASTYKPSCGSGYFLQDGQPLKAIRIPLIRDKVALKRLLQKKARDKFGNF